MYGTDENGMMGDVIFYWRSCQIILPLFWLITAKTRAIHKVLNTKYLICFRNMYIQIKSIFDVFLVR